MAMLMLRAAEPTTIDGALPKDARRFRRPRIAQTLREPRSGQPAFRAWQRGRDEAVACPSRKRGAGASWYR